MVPVSVVVLAAGQGKRMHSALPKVLQPLAGRPLLEHVVRSARAIEPAAIHIVYGHGADAVRAAFAAQTDLRWVHQAEQLGTGHAVMQAMPQVPDGHDVLVLFGDVPLVRPATLERLLAAAVRHVPVLALEALYDLRIEFAGGGDTVHEISDASGLAHGSSARTVRERDAAAWGELLSPDGP